MWINSQSVLPRVVPEYKEEAKSRILEAANQLFAEKGYRQATMEDVAKRINVSKGALYLYFASKEELFEAICRSEPLALKNILYESFSEDIDPLESASIFFDKMMGRYGSAMGLSFEIFSEASHNPTLKRILKKTQDEYVQVLENFLTLTQKKGQVNSHVDLQAVTYASIALWNGIETLVVSGLSLPEAKKAWLEGFKAIFLQRSFHK